MKIHNTLSCSVWPIHLHTFFLFSVTFLCLQLTTATNTPTNVSDQWALLKFKESISNDPQKILSSWNSSLHFCNWHGITCSRRHQRVTVLKLHSYDLRGSISPYIGNLTFLRFMELWHNNLYGEIPQEIGRLFRLQNLTLSENMLSGEIPANLSRCSKLRFIQIGGNKFSGKIPVGLDTLTKLEGLVFNGNNLIGGIPPSFGNLSSLRYLYLAYNNLSGNIPDDIGRLKSLSRLILGENKLSGMVPPSVFNLSSLIFFVLTGNQLIGTLPANIGFTLPNVEYFAPAINEFSGPIPISLCNVSRMKVLDLGANNFVGQVPKNLGNLPDLSWVHVGNNNLGSYSANDLDFIASLTNCSKLNALGLFENHFGGVLPNSIANLTNQLSRLELGNNHISGNIPDGLGNLVNLIELDLNFNLLTGTIPTYLGRIQNMRSLNLSGNTLTGHIPSSIGNLTQLLYLILSQNKLRGTIPTSIGNCQDLLSLTFAKNNLSGPIPEQLISISSLALFADFSQNSITGSLPVAIGNLEHIYTLNFSENYMSGEIPSSIGDCLSLTYLYLQGNHFRGSIPSTLASLKGLQGLDLSRNNLSGEIPKELQKLPFLLYLNLSFNNLEGEVPTQGIFRNASAISVIGNRKLCGGIQELQLPTCPNKVSKPRKSPSIKLIIAIACSVLACLLLSFFLTLYRSKLSKKIPSPMVSTMDLFANVSYKSLSQATNGFSCDNLIGSGSFGSVYKGVLGQEEKVVAIKVFNLQQKRASKSFMVECNALRSIRHRNLVKILTCCSSISYNGNDFKALVFEFMQNGSLDSWLHREIDNETQSMNLSVLQRLNIAIDVANALHYLHDQLEEPIIHCDLKPSNILLDNDMVAHVGDFGLARILCTINDSSLKQTSTIGIMGSIGYAPPEYGLGVKASTQGDVYSYGILILEMVTGRRPTDPIFKDGLNLHKFVMMALPGRLFQIVDPTLLLTKVDEMVGTSRTKRMVAKEDNSNIEIEADEETNNKKNLSHMNDNVHKCLLSILRIGFACSVESAKERMNLTEVIRELHLIRDTFLDCRIHGGNYAN